MYHRYIRLNSGHSSNLLNNLNLLYSQPLLFDLSISVMLDLLVRDGSDIESPFLAVEVLCNLLKRSVASFDEEEVDDKDFKGEEDAVADVVLPLECLECDCVYEMICRELSAQINAE